MVGRNLLCCAIVICWVVGCGDSNDGADADPDFLRTCETGDFVCSDFGCEGTLVSGECYQRCTPDSDEAIGAVDSECPRQRPYCGQIGVSGGGDFDCNDCAHVCMAFEDVNQCERARNVCGG